MSRAPFLRRGLLDVKRLRYYQWLAQYGRPTLVLFKTERDKLSTQQDRVLRGARVLVPASFQKKVLQEFPQTHLEISQMKALPRSYVCLVAQY